MEQSYFEKALSDFTFDMASGGAIRHLTDLGFSVNEIAERLDYPTPVEKIKETVWKHLVQQGILCMDDPTVTTKAEKITYKQEYSDTGKMTFRRVVEHQELSDKVYIPCDFGKRRYQNEALFLEQLSSLNVKDRDYILGLPWPLQTVWHVADERMIRIRKVLEKQRDTEEKNTCLHV